METIASKQNNYIKYLRSLYQKKNRIEQDAFIVEGVKMLQEALDANVEILSVFFDDYRATRDERLIRDAETRGIALFQLNQQVMDSVCDTQTPQGIGAVIRANDVLQNFDEKKVGSFVVALDRLQDPYNVGTIIRTADAAGVDTILLSQGCVDVLNEKVVRGTMGSLFHVRLMLCDDLVQAVVNLKDKSYQVIGGHLQGTDFYDRTDCLDEKLVLTVGNEATGLCEDMTNVCDYLYKLPMIGRAESLNAAVAASVMLYDIVRTRRDNATL